jgi:hypothetical protein
MTTDEPITAMLDVASDAQADTLDDLLVACGYWRICACGPPTFVKVGDACDDCGNVAA